ncbi:MAG: rod-binding protein [Planctomycetia bacterium]|nr:rod-binding protein [Planctomycetia bacterium]
MNAILPTGAAPAQSSTASLLSRMNKFDEANRAAPSGDMKVREKFQDFAAGTFYKEMLKALRQGQKHSKYFYGGQAEEIFRGQMDQQVAENLARQHGGTFAGPLYDAYARQSLPATPQVSPQVSSRENVHAFDAVA